MKAIFKKKIFKKYFPKFLLLPVPSSFVWLSSAIEFYKFLIFLVSVLIFSWYLAYIMQQDNKYIRNMLQKSLLRFFKTLILFQFNPWFFGWSKEGISATITCIYFNQISALFFVIIKDILIKPVHIYLVSQNSRTSIFLYHCWT